MTSEQNQVRGKQPTWIQELIWRRERRQADFAHRCDGLGDHLTATECERVRGQNSSRRPVLLGAVALALCAAAVHATPPPSGVAPVLTPAGGFNIDGDLMANTPGANTGDWLAGPGGTGAGVLDAQGNPLNPATTFHYVDPYNSSSDTTFKSGSKWTDNPNSWQWTLASASSKTDINNVLMHIASDANGHVWTVIAADRASTSGDSYIDFEFLQNTMVRTNGGAFYSAGLNGGRTTNDLLLSLAFTSGGAVADFFAYRWQSDGMGGYTYVDVTASLPVGGVFVAANSTNAYVPYGAFGSTNYAANAFAEAAIDLTALLGNFNQCLSYGFKTIMVKTKTSASGSSTISDFIDPIQYSLRIGPSANAGANQVLCSQGDSTAFPLQGVATAGSQPVVSTTWSVVSGIAEIESPSSLITTAHVASASATLRLTVAQGNGCSETSDIVLTVVPPISGSMTGPAIVCPRGAAQFSAPAGMSSYAWSITGNGTISGATNGANVNVVAGPTCGSGFVVSLQIGSNVCWSSCSQTVAVLATNPPSLTIPADVVLECPANTATNQTGSATAFDDCGTLNVTYSDTRSNLCGNTYVISRLWTAADACGNSTQAVQTITVQDTRPPVVTAPPNRTLECPGDLRTSNTGVATASDGCSSVVVNYSDVTSNACGLTKVVYRTWTATDACGNSASAVQTITVRDTTPPTITAPPNVTLECPANTATNATGVPVAQDGCGNVTVTFSDVVSNTCGSSQIIYRTWRATDDCGNSATALQTITVRDTTAPTVTPPADLTLECPADTTTNNTGVATFQDSCSLVTLRYSDVTTNSCAGNRTIRRTWTATDACGNSSSAVQTIIVRDTTPPTLTAPPNLVLDCPANTGTNATGVAVSQDGCSAVTISYSDSVSNVCTGAKIILRTWTAADGCGNAVSAVQTITVRDITPPTLHLPADLTLECPANTGTNATGVATAQDTCSQVTVTYSDVVSNICGSARVIARTWTAADQCGNAVSGLQTITVRDTTPPSLTVPASVTLECPANTTTNATGAATATDTCNGVVVQYSDTVSNSCGNTKVISRLWTATDACGNSTNRVQLITVRDTTPPTITAPPSLTLECPANTATNATGMAVAQDGCSKATVSYSDIVSNTCGSSQIIYRTWRATDDCGNTATALQTITVRDTTAPTVTPPADLTLECPANTTTNATGVATVYDSCSLFTLSYSDVSSNSCAGNRTIRRTWTATDACGNSASAVQTITVRDTTAPTLTVPPNLVLECPANTGTNATGVATTQDGCSASTLTYSDSVTNICAGAKTVLRTWTAADGCGNAVSAVQTITVRDTHPPTLNLPANVTLECPANTTTNATGVATATDTCSAVTLTYSDVVSNSCGAANVIFRTWTANDQCGNSVSGVQTITVRDTTPPTLRLPASVTLECPANTTTNATGTATATDTCNAVVVQYSDTVSNSCGNAKVISRLWIATDACGNTTNGLQTITVRDTTPPTITAPPSLTLECPANTATNATGMAVAQDGCSKATVSYSDIVSNTCGSSQIIYRTWRATDDCGNTVTALQTITVRDTTAPTVTPPADLTLECPANTATNNTGVATVYDSCSLFTLSYSDVSSNSCAGNRTIRRTWTATDACGNTANAVQTITVRDTTPPTLTVPPDLTLECPASPSTNATGVATAQDGCSAATVTYSDSVTNPCPGTTVTRRTWTAVDSCGNAVSAVQTISVRDTHPPTLTLPANRVLDCPADTSTNNTGVATATDACSAVAISYSDVSSNSCGGARTISRTWRAADQCGNLATGVQTITVRDITPPTLTVPPNLTMECTGSVTTNVTGTATSIDGCSSVTIRYSDTVSNICGGSRIISRLWTATDGCGNATNGLQVITLLDTTPPSLALPANLVQECPGDTRTNVTGVPVAVDACSAVVLNYSDVVSNSCGSTKTVWRTWTATDACGNTTNGLQTIVVRDTTAPSITCPTISVQCAGDVPAPYTNLTQFRAAGGTASDACSSTLSFSLVSDTGLVGSCPGTETRVYRVADACGNFADGTQQITVRDTIPPVLTVPTNRIVQCGLALDPTNTGAATATDNCSTNVSITYSDAYVSLSSSYSFGFYAADPGSNSGPYAPTYLKFAPANLPPPAEAVLTGRAADPLRNAVAYSPSGSLDALMVINGGPVCYGQIVPFEVVITVSGTGTRDENGTVEFTADWATYTTSNSRFGYDTNYMIYSAFVDYADPGTIDPYGTARVESYSSRVINRGTSTEEIEGVFKVSGLQPGDRVVVEIWVVLDPDPHSNAGGTIAAGLVAAQKDTVPPQAISTGTQTTGIGNLSKLNPLPAPQAQPPLGPLPTQPTVPPGVLVNVINRTFVATDNCGNQSTGTQQITVRDATPPVLTVPPDLTLECPADTSTNSTGTATAIDACGTCTLTYTDSVTNGCAGTRVIARLWTATDYANNTTNAVQMITVQDTTPPTLTVPPDLTLAVSADTTTNATGVATAHDGCGSVTLSYADVITNSCGTSFVLLRTWTAIDTCGNSTNVVQTITVGDRRPPTITAPPSLTLECPANTSTNATGVAVAQSTVGLPTLSYLDAVTNGCGGSQVITRTWTAIDACGNSASSVQTITVRDTRPPTLNVPSNLTLECPANTGTNATGVATAQDTCSQVTLSYSDVVSNSCGAARVINRIWTAADQCGNTVSAVQTITVRDTTPPSLTVPPNLTLECPADTTTNATGVATATDTCSGVVVQYSDTVSNSCGNTKMISRLWTATDSCGNATNAVQMITVRDTTPPTLTVPADLTLEAPADTTTNATGVATAHDGCGGVTVTYSDVVTNSCGGSYLLFRTWTATDTCGNSTNEVQTITVSDKRPPTITAPPSLTLECPADTSTNATGVAVAQAVGASLTLSYVDAVTNGCGSSQVITRTWTATENCSSNSASAVQTITVRDTKAPALAYKVSDTFLSTAFGQVAPRRVSFRDSFVSTFPAGLVIGDTNLAVSLSSTRRLVWEGTTNGWQSLLVAITNNTIPSGTLLQSDLNPTNTCGGGPLACETLALTLNIAFNNAGRVGAGPNDLGGVIYTNAGDSLDAQNINQILAVANRALAGLNLPAGYDAARLASLLQNLNSAFANSSPSAWAQAHLGMPVITVSCAGDVPAVDSTRASAVDGCGGPVTITASPDAISDQHCPGQYTITRTWLAVDACGNSSSASVKIQVSDTIPPVLTVAAQKDVQAGQPWTFDSPTATDNCGGQVVVSVVSTTTNYPSPGVTAIVRVWQAQDACGNLAIAQQTVLVHAPTTPPVITTQPRGEAAAYGGVLTLTAAVSGTGPFTYQWLLNGVAIAGATNSTYQVNQALYGNAGVYTVVVSNAAGSVTSVAALVNVVPRLEYQRTTNGMVLTWPAPYILQSANTPRGVFQDVRRATSPYLVNTSLPQQYFRLRNQSFALSLQKVSGGYQITGAGMPGCNFILQASTNLVSWSNLATNTGAINFTDTSAANYPQRFYRAVLATP